MSFILNDNKVIYFDPKDGRSASSRTIEGVCEQLGKRAELEDKVYVIEQFKHEAHQLLRHMECDGVLLKELIRN